MNLKEQNSQLHFYQTLWENLYSMDGHKLPSWKQEGGELDHHREEWLCVNRKRSQIKTWLAHKSHQDQLLARVLNLAYPLSKIIISRDNRLRCLTFTHGLTQSTAPQQPMVQLLTSLLTQTYRDLSPLRNHTLELAWDQSQTLNQDFSTDKEVYGNHHHIW